MNGLTRGEKNALWLGFGAFLAVVLIGVSLLLPNPNCNVAYIKLQGDLVTYPSEFGGVLEQKQPESSTDALLNMIGVRAQSDSDDSDSTDSDGMGVTASEDVTQAIRDANADSSMKAIVLEIDSPGGSPVAGEEVEKALKDSTKPTVALIRDEGDSAAYMAATGAQTIFASQFSDVGDIGITSSYTDQSIQDAANGITFNQLSIGKYKDLGNPDKPLTSDERTLVLSQLQTYYQDFVQLVAQNRHLSIATATALANGSGIPGQAALADGLIDKIGGYAEVQSFLSSKIHGKAVMCDSE